VLQFGIDDIYTLATLCACTLLKLTRPHVASFVASEMRENGLAMIPRLVSKLERCAADEHHTAAVYALYIRRLRRQADVWIARESSTRAESAGQSSLRDVPPMSPGDFVHSSSELWTAEFMEAGRTVQVQSGLIANGSRTSSMRSWAASLGRFKQARFVRNSSLRWSC
jgi:hypothetical protein